MTFTELRQRHPSFVYQGFSWKQSEEALTIRYQYLLEPGIKLESVVKIKPISREVIDKLDQDQLQAWLLNLGMIELFSYWKAAVPADIVIEAGRFNQEQLAWWKDLLIKGMGEFFYTNQIDFTASDFVTLTVSDQAKTINAWVESGQGESDQAVEHHSRPLVPVGGGKDSATVIELLEENGLDYDILLSFPQSPAAAQMAQLSRAKDTITIQRTLDPKLLELNQQGYLNGHTPFSARLAFESSLVAWLMGHPQILLGNEFSANEGNVPYLETTVNHQYSKTFEFEQNFRSYASQYLNPAPEYVSLLRPLHELQIAGIFAQYPRYHQLFRSCNREQQAGNWCGECPKCLFVFTVLYPFLKEAQLIGPIFPKNLFAKISLKDTALAMLGKDEHKPFECIGTYQETLTAFYLSVKHYRQQHPNQDLPALLQFIESEILANEPDVAQYAQEVLCGWNGQHHLKETLNTIVKAAQERLCEQAQEKYEF